MKVVYMVCALMIMVTVSGCSTPEEVAVEKLEVIIKKLAQVCDSDGVLDYHEFKYSVRTSNSLVFPYAAEIDFYRGEHEAFQCILAYQSDKREWILKEIQHELRETSRMTHNEKAVRSISMGIHAFVIDGWFKDNTESESLYFDEVENSE